MPWEYVNRSFSKTLPSGLKRDWEPMLEGIQGLDGTQIIRYLGYVSVLRCTQRAAFWQTKNEKPILRVKYREVD